MGRCHGVLIETLSRCGLAAGLAPVIGGHPGERASDRCQWSKRGVGMAPKIAQGVGFGLGGGGEMMMAVGVVMMPVRFGRSFGDASAGQTSCGENSYRRAGLS